MVNDDKVREQVPQYDRIVMNRNRKTTAAFGNANSVIFVPARIVSGGQTGVDRAGLDLAIAIGIEHGGWCPRGRLAEDGTIPSRYELSENDSRDYTVRTRQNVVDSDATLILYERRLRGGTLLTQKVAVSEGKPHLCVAMGDDAVGAIRDWLRQWKPMALNIAGPRESSHPGIGSRAFDLLISVFAS